MDLIFCPSALALQHSTYSPPRVNLWQSPGSRPPQTFALPRGFIVGDVDDSGIVCWNSILLEIF